MGISVDFVVKHIRPYGIHAIANICGAGSAFLAYLHDQLNVDDEDIDTISRAWASAGMLEVDAANLAQLTLAAEIAAEGRWTELYPTQRSTILFMSSTALANLSQAAALNPGAGNNLRQFHVEFDAGDVPLAVTIYQDPHTAPDYFTDVTEIEIGVDANGNCVHFQRIVAATPWDGT